jgi:hypothetical protein
MFYEITIKKTLLDGSKASPALIRQTVNDVLRKLPASQNGYKWEGNKGNKFSTPVDNTAFEIATLIFEAGLIPNVWKRRRKKSGKLYWKLLSIKQWRKMRQKKK